jgi:type I restriction enzyme S subunit
MKEGWEQQRLVDLCDLITKGTTPTSIGYNYTDEGINFIKVESLTENGEIILSKVAFINEDCHQALKRSQLKENDILFSIAGALGRIGIVNNNIIPANTNQALAIIRLKIDAEVSVKFLSKYFNSEVITKEIKKLGGGTAQQNLSLGQLNELKITYPPLPEQQRIVSIIDKAFEAIDKAIENTQKNLQNSKELFESCLQGVFHDTGEGWAIKTLGEVCKIVGGGTPSKNRSDFYGGTINWATVRDLNSEKLLTTEHTITTLGLQNCSTNLIAKNNVIFASRVGLGKVCLTKIDVAINQDLRAPIPKNLNQLDVNYLFRWFQNQRDIIIKAGQGATVQGITLPFINNLPIPIPPLLEQQTFVRKLDALNSETRKLEGIYQQKLRDLKELKKSVLNKAFAGEL